MSKGSKITPVRIPPLLLAAIHEAIRSANKTRKAEPYTMSSWILTAIDEKLNHNLRSRSKVSRSRFERAIDVGLKAVDVGLKVAIVNALVSGS